MNDLPLTYDLAFPQVVPSHWDAHLTRSLSNLRGQFRDAAEFDRMLSREDSLVYEVYEFHRPHIAGELLTGISIVHPGRVGEEFFMTKGHFHAELVTAEVYYCLKGQGVMVMENPQGDWAVEELKPGRVLYVPPCWAHRSVNTADREDLVTLFIYPGNAGHDYGTIEQQGFRKSILAGEEKFVIADNPRWMPPEKR